MGQKDIFKEIRLLFFNDQKLKDLMLIPDDKKDDLIAFRDYYCVTGVNNSPVVITNDVPVRLTISWMSGSKVNNNDRVLLRKFGIEVYVGLDYEYDTKNNALDRRAELILNRIIYLLSEKRIKGFLFKLVDVGDLDSFNYDYMRSFATFNVKNIY